MEQVGGSAAGPGRSLHRVAPVLERLPGGLRTAYNNKGDPRLWRCPHATLLHGPASTGGPSGRSAGRLAPPVGSPFLRQSLLYHASAVLAPPDRFPRSPAPPGRPAAPAGSGRI